MITDKISSELPIKELYNELCKTFDDVKISGKNSLKLTNNDTKIIITKKKKGYDVSPNIPGYVFWLCFLLVVIIFSV